jgi:hypothetical protein
MLILMSFKYSSSNVKLINSMIKDEGTPDILYSSVERMSVLQFIVNSNFSMKFKCSSDDCKIGIVCLHYADGWH